MLLFGPNRSRGRRKVSFYFIFLYLRSHHKSTLFVVRSGLEQLGDHEFSFGLDQEMS